MAKKRGFLTFFGAISLLRGLILYKIKAQGGGGARGAKWGKI